jgi:hypothetical protein
VFVWDTLPRPAIYSKVGRTARATGAMEKTAKEAVAKAFLSGDYTEMTMVR